LNPTISAKLLGTRGRLDRKSQGYSLKRVYSGVHRGENRKATVPDSGYKRSLT